MLRAIDKLDRLGVDGVSEHLLGRAAKTKAVTSPKALGLEQDDIQIQRKRLGLVGTEIVLTVLASENDSSVLQISPLSEWEISSYLGASKVLMELKTNRESLRQPDMTIERILIDPSVVRGLEYYTGPVYEVELTFETKDDKGRPVRFGSVGGGGRYDGLVSRFRGEPVPATGFSIGVSRLQAALTALGKLGGKPQAGPVVVTVFDRDRIADYQKMAAALRNAGIRAELYLGNPKNNLGQQLKYADKRASPCAIIQGGDEKAQGVVQIKDLILGAGLADIKDRDEYLKKQAEAQFAVKEDGLVDAVLALLKRHSLG